jgi:hypothetical protein
VFDYFTVIDFFLNKSAHSTNADFEVFIPVYPRDFSLGLFYSCLKIKHEKSEVLSTQIKIKK